MYTFADTRTTRSGNRHANQTGLRPQKDFKMANIKKSVKQALIIKEMLKAQRFLVESLNNDGEPVQGKDWRQWRELLEQGAKQLQETGIDIYQAADVAKKPVRERLCTPRSVDIAGAMPGKSL